LNHLPIPVTIPGRFSLGAAFTRVDQPFLTSYGHIFFRKKSLSASLTVGIGRGFINRVIEVARLHDPRPGIGSLRMPAG
jgi:hypothetical protein